MAKQLKIDFTGLTLLSIIRNPKKAEASFSANLTATILDRMGWDEMRDFEKSTDLDGELAAQQMILGMKDTLAAAYEITVDIQSVSAFQGVRQETKGKRSKGKRHVLYFKVRFADVAMGLLEEYLLKVPEGKGNMTVLYLPGAVQGVINDVTQTEAAKQATLKEND